MVMSHGIQSVVLRVDGGRPTVDGRPVAMTEGASAHDSGVAAVIRMAQAAGAPLQVMAYDDHNRVTSLVAHPQGHVEVREERPAQTTPHEVGPGHTAPSPSAGVDRASFITAGRAVQPAANGWRGTLNALGLRLAPGEAEKAERGDVAAISRHWPGARTVAVVNAKGSASKTPTVACLSAIFARVGGSGVLAWDNNETEGTLRFRTEWSNHQATILDLLPHVDRLRSPSAAVAEMSSYVHHQPADRYDVLWSDTTVDGDHVASSADVDAIHRVASRYYRMILMDSGNNSRAENWRAMVDRADAIVVPCTEVEDTAEVGARLLEALHQRGGRSAHLASNALVLVSQRTPKGANLDRIVEGFKPLARAVVQIPYDPALETGVIRYDNLSPASQRAWLRAAAELAAAL